MLLVVKQDIGGSDRRKEQIASDMIRNILQVFRQNQVKECNVNWSCSKLLTKT